MYSKKTIRGLSAIAILLIIAAFIAGRLSTSYELVATGDDSAITETDVVVETGTVEIATGAVEETGVVDTGSLSGFAIDAETAPTVNVAFACQPGAQPTEHAGNYAGNSEILNAWLFNHKCTFEDSDEQTWSDNAKLVITLHKPTTAKNQVFFYFFGNNVAGRLEAEVGAQTIEFPLDEVVVFTRSGTVEFNFASKLANTSKQEFGGYVAIFDGNYIESIEIID